MSDPCEPSKILVSDFDGTITRHDFFKLVIEKLLPPDTPDYWAEYRSGAITHFEALRRYFASIRHSEEEIMRIVNGMEIDPHLAASVEALKRGGWMVIVASAGCDWYIRRLLAAAGATLEVHANPGRFETGKGLLMQMPEGSPFLSQMLGVDKSAIVRHHTAELATVAFAGDGFPDAEAARLVPGTLRFARGDLAGVLAQEGLGFHPFETWSDVARVLLAG